MLQANANRNVGIQEYEGPCEVFLNYTYLVLDKMISKALLAFGISERNTNSIQFNVLIFVELQTHNELPPIPKVTIF